MSSLDPRYKRWPRPLFPCPRKPAPTTKTRVRKPSMRSLIAQAERAGLEGRFTLNPDGSLTVEPTAEKKGPDTSSNDWDVL